MRLNRSLVVIFLISTFLIGSMGTEAKVTISLVPDGTQGMLDALIPQFEAGNPDIEVEVLPLMAWQNRTAKIAVMTAGGVAPDVINVVPEQFREFHSNGYMRSLDPFIQRDKVDMRAYPAPVTAMWQIDDVQYALPLGINTLNQYYNQTLFDQSGVAYPELDTWTWDWFVQSARKLTADTNGDGQTDQWGTAHPGRNIWAVQPFLMQNGGSVLKPDWRSSNLQSPASVQAFEWLVNLRYVHGVVPDGPTVNGAGGVGRMLTNNQLAMMPGGREVSGNLTRMGNDHFDVTFLPRGKAGFATAIGGQAYMMQRDTKHPEEAWRLIRHLCDEEAQKLLLDTGILPTLTRVARMLSTNSAPKSAMLFIEQLAYGRPVEAPIGFTDVNAAVNQGVGVMFGGTESVQAVVERVAAQVNSILAEKLTGR